MAGDTVVALLEGDVGRGVAHEAARRLDTTDLEERVKDMYREVAEEPHKDCHFETGRPLAERLGYPPTDLPAQPARSPGR